MAHINKNSSVSLIIFKIGVQRPQIYELLANTLFSIYYNSLMREMKQKSR